MKEKKKRNSIVMSNPAERTGHEEESKPRPPAKERRRRIVGKGKEETKQKGTGLGSADETKEEPEKKITGAIRTKLGWIRACGRKDQ